jgi:hypothetical protein
MAIFETASGGWLLASGQGAGLRIFFRPFGAYQLLLYPGLAPWAVIFRRFAAFWWR